MVWVSSKIRFLLLLLSLASPGLAVATPLVNPDFDTDLAGWNAFGGTWASFDADGNPESGSVLLAGTDQLSQCVPVTPGASAAGGASVFVPSGQSGSANLFVSLRYHASADCSGLGFNQQLFVNVVPFDAWTFVSASVFPEVPEGAHSGAFTLDFLSVQGGFEAYFDAAHLTFVPEPSIALVTMLIAAQISASRRNRPT